VTVFVENDQPVKLRGIMVDITERKRLEDERSRHGTELATRVLQAQEEERKRIARELHDETAQSLTSLLIGLRLLEKASAPDDLVERAVELGLTGLAVTDHNGLYGAVRFASAAEAAGLHPVVGIEIELLDPVVADPAGIVVPHRRVQCRGARTPVEALPADVTEGLPIRPRPSRARLPGHRATVKEDLRGIGERSRGPHLVLLARSAIGWRSLCRLVSHANMAGTKGVPRFSQALLAEHTEGLVALSGCRDGELARRLRTGDLAGARAVAERYATLFGRGDGPATNGFFIELSHHLLPDDDWLVTESAALARLSYRYLMKPDILGGSACYRNGNA